MDYIRDRISNIPFSLHDSRIIQIEINETTLTLRLDRIFQYAGDEEKWYQGIIEFTKADIEECDIMLFNRPYGYDGEKSFTGESISLAEFNAKYPDAVFEMKLPDAGLTYHASVTLNGDLSFPKAAATSSNALYRDDSGKNWQRSWDFLRK